MRRNKLALYLHLVWSTWDRLPMVTPQIERRLYRCIESEARDQGCTVLALNGVPDHVHLVVSFPATITISNLMKQVKGVSSHFVNKALLPDTQFKWSGGYGAFTVSRWDVDKVVQYVKRQKEHHTNDSLWPEWEEAFEEFHSLDRSPSAYADGRRMTPCGVISIAVLDRGRVGWACGRATAYAGAGGLGILICVGGRSVCDALQG